METFKALAETNNWQLLWPEIALGLLALLLLPLEFTPFAKRKGFIPLVSILAQALILVFVLSGTRIVGAGDVTAFGGLIKQSAFTPVLRAFFLISSLGVSYLGYIYLQKNKLPRVEFFHLVLVVTAGLMLLVQSNHFVMLFVALEMVSIGFMVLVSYCRSSSLSLEAGLKFLILAALSSSVLLFGIVLLYGVAGNPLLPGATADSMNFEQLAHFIALNQGNLFVRIGVALVISGIAFKVGAFPFQIWIPDVYQGAPTPVTAFLAISSKAAGVIVLLNLVHGPFAPLQGLMVPFLSAIAGITILFGNITALPQTNVKRLIGLSGIAHAGYMLLGVIASFYVSWAISALIFYLIVYMLSSFAVFFVMVYVSKEDDAMQGLEDYENIARSNPFLSSALLVGLASLAGIPPLGGFVAKVLLFIAAFQAKLYVLLGIAFVGVVISIYYYFGWMRDAWFYVWKGEEVESEVSGKPEGIIRISLTSRIVIFAIMALTLLLGIYQEIIF